MKDNKISRGDTFVSGNNFSNTSEVHIGDRIHQEIHDSSVSYELNMADVSGIESLSIYLTGKMGDSKVGIIGIIGLISGLITIFSSFNSFFDNIRIITWLPSFSKSIGIPLFIVGLILVTIGSILLNALRYKQDTRCDKCRKDYAYREYKSPYVKEVETREGTRKNTTRFLECRYCKDRVERKSHKIIPYEKEEDTF